MVLTGYKVVEEGDRFYYGGTSTYWITIEAGNPLIGKTVWIYKNSWGPGFGDVGYVYVETPITNIGSTYAIQTPITSLVQGYDVVCEDKDGDGYFWWGLGEKPETCDCPDQPDGDDSDPTLGPLDEYGNCIKLTPTLALVNVPASKHLGQNPELPTCDEGVTATDGCSEASVSCIPGEILEDGCERSQTFTYSATDDCGNTVSAITTYTWTEDLTPPILTNIPADQYLGTNPETPTCNPEVSAIDECSEVIVTCLPGEIIQNENEFHQVFTYLATDGCGNTNLATTTYTWTEYKILPVADFSTSSTTITQFETVNFEDLSTGNPTSWYWTFEGGIPATTTAKNPIVKYEIPGVYGVSLTVTNSDGSNTKTSDNFITVNEFVDEYIENPVSDYCLSNGNASLEWIASVNMNMQTHTSGSSNDSGYEDFTGFAFTAEAGKNINFTLTPAFLNRWQKQYWRIWIDYNQDNDFDDAGELVFTSSLSKGEVSGDFTVKPNINLTTRMRISMKREVVPTPCETFNFGETEDYAIQIGEPAPQPPIADFTASQTNVKINETIQFTDLSSNDPTQWHWQFPGGVPEISTEQNPVITYPSAGEFDVTLVVAKKGFDPSQKMITNCISVTEIVTETYCTPLSVNSTSDYIQNISIGNVLNNSAVGTGYTLAAANVSFLPGELYTVSLTPKEPSNRNFWRIWIDLNEDGDFTDADETLLVINNKKGTVSSEISIPQYASGDTRMRVAMRNNTAPTPCDDSYDGEVKDFPVFFETAPQASQLSVGNQIKFDEISGIKLYPNPVSNELTIRLGSSLPGDNYTIYNLNGKKLKTDWILSEITTIDFSEYAPGVYFIAVDSNKITFRGKVIKK
jgi:PKD repeat protein